MIKEIPEDGFFHADPHPVAFRHHLHLLSELWLLGKALSVMEGVGLRLATVLVIGGLVGSSLLGLWLTFFMWRSRK